MARANEKNIKALRTAAHIIEKTDAYQWGNMGACNCGHLAQVVTGWSRANIHEAAMNYGVGDWNDQLREFCPTSKMPFNEVVNAMLELGFSIDDLMRLEKLSDQNVLARLPFAAKLQKNNQYDVAIYLTLWADLLEEELHAHHQVLKKFEKPVFY